MRKTVLVLAALLSLPAALMAADSPDTSTWVRFTSFSYAGKTAHCVAGLAAFQNEGHYYAINVKIDSGHLAEVSLEQAAGRGSGRGPRSGDETPQPKILATEKLPDNVTSIGLKIEGSGPTTRCLYRVGSGEFTQLGQDLQSSFLSTDTAGGFQGVTLGMFAHN